MAALLRAILAIQLVAWDVNRQRPFVGFRRFLSAFCRFFRAYKNRQKYFGKPTNLSVFVGFCRFFCRFLDHILWFSPRVGTRPDQNDRLVGVGRVGDVTDRPDFRSEDRKWSVGLLVGVLVGRWSDFGRSVGRFYVILPTHFLKFSF